ncbi:MAG: thioredoxin domain-containing protein [Candidatus Omnitrophica bacterium]|nr:thioredoxin domain-containing protein [Candidatus Omnitrophota bacterium]
MKNNILVITWVMLVGLLSGLALLVGINTTVGTAMTPLMSRLNQIEMNQRMIAQKVNLVRANTEVLTRLSAIENQLASLQNKASAGAPAFAPLQPPPEDFDKVYAINIGSSPVNGKKNAPVTIVEFSDLQCPFCARFHPSVKETLSAYPDKVKLVMKNFPLSFHPNARPAAKLALAAHEQGKYYEMVDLLLQNRADVSEAKVKEYAGGLHLNYDKLMNDLRSKDAEYERRISDDLALGDSVDVRGTPTFFINGKKTVARDFNNFKAEIDKILAGK